MGSGGCNRFFPFGGITIQPTIAQLVKNLPAMQETPVQFLGWEDRLPITVFMGFSGGSDGKESACNAGDLGSVPGLGISPGDREGYPLQYSDLENSMDCVVRGVTKSQTQLNNFHFPQLPGCGPLWVRGL